MQCPDHPRDLVADAQGHHGCPFCKGMLLTEHELGEHFMSQLSVETREKSGAFAKVRSCPSCSAPLVPYRIGKLEAWIEKCPSCEHFWVENHDRTILTQSAKRQARAAAFESFSDEDRKELARDLAAATAPPAGVELTTFQMVLALFGVPVITRTKGNRLPYVTWSLSALLIVIYLLGIELPEALGPEALGYTSGEGLGFSVVTANFVHFGLLHLVGNVAFLLAFGDGVEQRWPRWILPVMFVLGGAATLLIEGGVADDGILIAGASGGIAVIMGACVTLQPQARVIFILFRGSFVARVPIKWWVVFALLYQVGMGLIGIPGVAWWAHGSGLILGVMLGLGTRNVDVQRESIAEVAIRGQYPRGG